DDVQSIVERVEPDSAAQRAGLLPGDRIVSVNGKPNGGVLTIVSDDPEATKAALSTAATQGATVLGDVDGHDRRTRILGAEPQKASALKNQLNAQMLFRGRVYDSDVYTDLVNSWPRGQQSLDLEVNRGGEIVHIGPFIPRTIGLHPTQLYETIS